MAKPTLNIQDLSSVNLYPDYCTIKVKFVLRVNLVEPTVEVPVTVTW
jgi:hypothetical protein